MSNCLFTKLPYDRPHISPAHPNWQTNKPKQRQTKTCFFYFKKAFVSIWLEGLVHKLMESGVGGKTYDIIKSMYTNNNCAVKIGKNTHTFLPTGLWGETWMQLKPHPLQHIYQWIGEGTITFCSTRPHPTRIWCLLFSDLVLLSPTKEGLQQHLDLLHRFWTFQKSSSCLYHKYKFHLDTI